MTGTGSWMDPVLPVKSRTQPDFSQPVSQDSFASVGNPRTNLKRRFDSNPYQNNLDSVAPLSARKKRYLERKKKYGKLKEFDREVTLLNRKFKERPPRPWLVNQLREKLLSDRKKNLAKIQEFSKKSAPVLPQTPDEKWSAHYAKYNFSLEKIQEQPLIPVVSSISSNKSSGCLLEKSVLGSSDCLTKATKDKRKMLKTILKFLSNSDFETKKQSSENPSTGNKIDLDNTFNPSRLEAFMFKSSIPEATLESTVSFACSQNKHVTYSTGMCSKSCSESSGSEDESIGLPAAFPKVVPVPKKRDKIFAEDSLIESVESDTSSDGSKSDLSSSSDEDASDNVPGPLEINASCDFQKPDDNSSEDSDSEDPIDEGLFRLLGKDAFTNYKSKNKPDLPIVQAIQSTALVSSQFYVKNTPSALGSVEFLKNEISLIVDQMMPPDLFDALWRHHLYQHSTTPVWDRTPVVFMPISGHQLGVDQKLVRVFDAFRPIPPSISTFYLDIQIKAAAALSLATGNYVRPGKAIDPSKQVPIPKKISGIRPILCFRHVNFI